MLAGLWLGLSSGCSSPSASQKVYDRYAELVASRTPSWKTSSNAAPAQVSAARVASKPAESADRRPAKTPAATAAPVAAAPAVQQSVPAASRPVAVPAPVAVASAAPAVAAPAAPAAAVPAVQPTPAKAPPVQVISPKPVEKAEIKPSPVPAPVLVPPAPVPAPAAVAAPAPIPAPSAPVPPPSAVVAPTQPLAASASSLEGGYMLKVGDGLQIYLRGIPTPEVIEDVIDEGGKVTLPLINEVQAAGLAASDLERNIRQTYLDQDIYRNITVNVVVPTRYYFIQGEVRMPGRFQIMSATRVSQAIAAAGGYTEYASGKVQVKRQGKIVKIIKNARRLERSPEDDVLLEPDDVIEVLRSWF